MLATADEKYERTLARNRAFYARNREKMKARVAAYRAEFGELILERHLLDPRGRMLAAARHRAKQEGLGFNITKDDIVIPLLCPVLGIPLAVTRGKHSFNSPSLDRLDNSLGYVKGNVHVISRRANALKNDATLAEMEAIVAYMRQHAENSTNG